jgi:hypothetical protein
MGGQTPPSYHPGSLDQRAQCLWLPLEWWDGLHVHFVTGLWLVVTCCAEGGRQEGMCCMNRSRNIGATAGSTLGRLGCAAQSPGRA